MTSERTIVLYIAPNGSDRWSGRRREASPDGADGPLATLEGARREIRNLRWNSPADTTVEVRLLSGLYALKEPFVWRPSDGGRVSFVADGGGSALIHGGERISHWRESTLNGRRAWMAHLPEVQRGTWNFRQLYVNGEPRRRPRWPKHGMLTMESVPGYRLEGSLSHGLFDGADRFHYQEGDVRRFRNVTDAEAVVLHYWVEERMPIQSLNEEQRLIVSDRRSVFALRDDVQVKYAEYYIDNVFEALDAPGEWYLDRVEGMLYYLPHDHETLDNTELYAPRLAQLIRLEGRPECGEFIEDVRFEGISFAYADWYLPDGGDPELSSETEGMDRLQLAGSPQAGYHLPGALSLRGARRCAFIGCRAFSVGFYAFDFREGCADNRIHGCEIADTGGGGIKLSGGAYGSPAALQSGRHKFTENHIHRGGLVFPSAVGIVIRHAFDNDVTDNHIHHYAYTGISCGWVWGYAPHVSRDNRIEYNEIHDIGASGLNDMSGIYLLGVQPGTVVRGNIVYRVYQKNYGGWGIYLDEGSSHILVENNVAYDTGSETLHLNSGRENIIRNNIFAFGQFGGFRHSNRKEHIGLTLSRNIFMTDGAPIFYMGWNNGVEDRSFLSDTNLLWDVSGRPIQHRDSRWDEEAGKYVYHDIPHAAFLATNRDLNSVIADPGFADAAERDFRMPADSPAGKIGFLSFEAGRKGARKCTTM